MLANLLFPPAPYGVTDDGSYCLHTSHQDRIPRGVDPAPTLTASASEHGRLMLLEVSSLTYPHWQTFSC